MSDDGIALHAAPHPLHITDEMLAAGETALSEKGWELPASSEVTRSMLKAVFTAMVHASPPEPDELGEAALEQALVEIEMAQTGLSEMVERVAKALDPEVFEPTLSPALAAFVEKARGVYDPIQERQTKARQRARTVIAAMREPTEAMLAAPEMREWAWRNDDAVESWQIADAWQSMIDAALEERK